MKEKINIYNLRIRKNEDPRIEKFLKSQSSGYSDVIRYLIEKEIAQNGIRDLSSLIPSKRNIDNMVSFDSFNGYNFNSSPIKNIDVYNEQDIKTKTEENILASDLIAEAEERIESFEITSQDEVIQNDSINNINTIYKEVVIDKEDHNITHEEKENKDDKEDYDGIPSCYL